MVTYSDMFQFCMLIVAVISLVVKVCNSKKKGWQSGAFSAAPAEAAANVTRAGVMLQEHYNSRGALDLWRAMDYDTAR